MVILEIAICTFIVWVAIYLTLDFVVCKMSNEESALERLVTWLDEL